VRYKSASVSGSGRVATSGESVELVVSMQCSWP
jgi:hypothetical protein